MGGGDLTNVDMSHDILGNANIQDSQFNGVDLSKAYVAGYMIGDSFANANLTGSTWYNVNTASTTWSNTICPDGTNSDNDGNTCIYNGAG